MPTAIAAAAAAPASDGSDVEPIFQLEDLEVEEVSLVDHPANKVRFLVVKAQETPMTTQAPPDAPASTTAKAEPPTAAPSQIDAITKAVAGMTETSDKLAAVGFVVNAIANCESPDAVNAIMDAVKSAASGNLAGTGDGASAPPAGVAGEAPRDPSQKSAHAVTIRIAGPSAPAALAAPAVELGGGTVGGATKGPAPMPTSPELEQIRAMLADLQAQITALQQGGAQKADVAAQLAEAQAVTKSLETKLADAKKALREPDPPSSRPSGADPQDDRGPPRRNRRPQTTPFVT